MKFSSRFLRHSSASNSGRTAAVARSAATSADDSVSPPGLPSITLSDPTSAVTSSEFG